MGALLINVFFFNDPATTEIYTLSLHDALPISRSRLDGRSVTLHEAAEEVRVRLIRHGQRRLAVVDDTGLLAGLVCLKRKLTGFCSDADVAERAAEAQSPAANSTIAFRCMPIAR